MPDERTDEIAREAARLIETGRAAEVGAAIRAAVDALGHHDAPRPGPGRVRRHARGLAMQALGAAAYDESVRAVWRSAEQLIAAVEHGVPEATAVLVGRAAKGQVDAGVTLHVRLYTARTMREVVDVLVALGYEEPTFETARTRYGRLDRIRFTEEGREVVVTRCPPDLHRRDRGDDRDLFDGRPIEIATGADLRRRLEERSDEGSDRDA